MFCSFKNLSKSCCFKNSILVLLYLHLRSNFFWASIHNFVLLILVFLYSLLVFINTSGFFFFFFHFHLMSYRLVGFICSRSVLFCYRIYEENCVICKQEPFDVFLPRPYAFCSLLFCLTVQARTSRTMLNKNQESRYPCLVPNPRGKAVGYLWCSLSCWGSPFLSYIYERFFFYHE